MEENKVRSQGLIIEVVTQDSTTVFYKRIGDENISRHYKSEANTFPWTSLKDKTWYAIFSHYDGNKWAWRKAWPINEDEVIEAVVRSALESPSVIYKKPRSMLNDR